MRQSFSLDTASIAESVRSLQARFAELGLAPKDMARYALTAETVLLQWQTHLGSSACFDVHIYKRFSKINLEICCAGIACDPLPRPDMQERLLDVFGRYLLLKVGSRPHYTYEKGVNCVVFSLAPPRQDNSTRVLLYHIAAAVALAVALKFAPEAVATFAIKELVAPLATVFSGFLTATMTFVVFFSIAASIVNLGSVDDLYSFAGKIIKKFLVLSLTCAALTTVIMFFLFPVHLTTAEQGQSIFGPIRDLLLQFIPTNFASAFTEKNIPQVIFLSVLFSTLILIFNETLEPLKKLILNCNALFLELLNILIRIMPLFVVLCILQGMALDFSNMLGLALAAVVTNAVLALTYGGVLWTKAIMKSGRDLWATFQQSLSIYTVAFWTMSSASVFPLQMTFCKDVLKLPPHIYNFGLPVGLVFNRIPVASSLVITIMTCMCVSGVSVTWQGLLLLAIQAVILTVAAPPVPGGMLFILTILFNQYAIPMESMGVAVMLLMAFDAFGATVCAMGAQAVLMDVTRETEPAATTEHLNT